MFGVLGFCGIFSLGYLGLAILGTGFEDYCFMAVSLDGASTCIVLSQKKPSP